MGEEPLPPPIPTLSLPPDAHSATDHASNSPAPDLTADDLSSCSDYSGDVASYAFSLRSQVTDYKFEHGRRYHAYKEGRYIYPNDEKEGDRLDIVHRMLHAAMSKKLFFSPIRNPQSILDLGTGTGIWAMEIADHFPEAKVLGNDLSPIQPRWSPPNVSWEVDDVEDLWTYPNSFDFIHCRALGAAIKNWPRLVTQCFDNNTPGGYTEFVDYDLEWTSPDGSLKEGSPVHTIVKQFIKATRETGMEPSPGPRLAAWARDAGFVNIRVKTIPLPVGIWPANKQYKEIGAWNYIQTADHIEGLVSYIFPRTLGHTIEDIEKSCAEVRAQLRDHRVHSMFWLYVVSCKKPEADHAMQMDTT